MERAVVSQDRADLLPHSWAEVCAAGRAGKRADGQGADSPDPLPAPSSRCPWLCCICCPKSACWPAALRGGPCCCPQTSSPWRHSLLRRKTCPRCPPSSTQVGALRNPRLKAPFQGSPAKPFRPEGGRGSQVVMAGKNPLALLVSGCREGQEMEQTGQEERRAAPASTLPM